MTPRCLVTLAPLATEGLSPAGQRELAGGRGVFPVRIDLARSDIVQKRTELMRRMSISGMQDKISLRLDRGKLLPVDRDGTHILKPVPATPFQFAHDLPANEHVTMLCAKRLGIYTAPCGLIRMADDELAYITRRFDRTSDGDKLYQEDFGALAEMSADSHGQNWKYDFSYERLGRLVTTHCAAQQRDLQEFYRRVAFCFLIGNGDAHIRNFSILRDDIGLVRLSPAYDLVNTSVHLPQDQEMGLTLLDVGADGKFSASYETLGFYSCVDFLALGDAIGLRRTDTNEILADIFSQRSRETIENSVRQSFLSSAAKDTYLKTVEDRSRKFSQSTHSLTGKMLP